MTPDTRFCTPGVEVQTGILQGSSTLYIDQMTIIQPTAQVNAVVEQVSIAVAEEHVA